MITLNNLSIYSNANTVYLLFEDSKLFTLTGEHTEVVLQVLDKLKGIEIKSFEDLDLDIDQDILNEVIEFLKMNNIILDTNKEEKELRVIKTLVIGDFSKDFNFNEFGRCLSTDLVKYQIQSVKSASNVVTELDKYLDTDLVILFTPLLDKIHDIYKINEFFYLKDKMIFVAGIGEQNITLGPLLQQKLETPCLESYIKRRITNLQKPELFLSISRIKDSINEHNLLECDKQTNYNLVVEFLKLELYNYIQLQRTYTLGRSITYDLFRGESFTSRLLPVHNLSYSKEDLITGFN